MTDNTDAKIAREWAEYITSVRELHGDYAPQARAAARYILATTTPPTMADIAWDDEVHAGLCADHKEYGLVRMLHKDGNLIHCIRMNGEYLIAFAKKLTPIPGTRLDLTPRREPETESTPDHPTELTTVADYRNAPEGTIAAAEDEEAWTKSKDGSWETYGIISGYSNYAMADGPRRVLRWGWEA